MSRRATLAAALLLAAAAGPAASAEPAAARKTAEDSLLLSSELLALIEAARRADRGLPAAATTTARAGLAAAPDVIHLGAIVYHAADDWRIWLNGRSYTPGAAPGALEILAVTAGAVRLAWRGDPARPPARFELRPNQSYLVASGAIVEGPVRSPRSAQADRGGRR